MAILFDVIALGARRFVAFFFATMFFLSFWIVWCQFANGECTWLFFRIALHINHSSVTHELGQYIAATTARREVLTPCGYEYGRHPLVTIHDH